jgi:N-acetylglucosaminyldiphosphoundecaprenol N-acetyl-beta-D-mannosaminyltransferase
MYKPFGIDFSSANMSELVRLIVREPVASGAGARIVVTANVDHVVQLRKNAKFESAYASAWAVTADGFPVYAYARARQASDLTRVTGSDLFANVMHELRPGDHRCFFVASSDETGRALCEALRKKGFESDSVDYCVPPFGFENEIHTSQQLSEKILAHGATHLFMGVGAPKSEIWCSENRRSLGDCYILCVGAGLEFFVGAKRRAPASFQKVGLEWFWRFMQEPRRMFRRYFIDSWGLVGAIVDDLRTKGLFHSEVKPIAD